MNMYLRISLRPAQEGFQSTFLITRVRTYGPYTEVTLKHKEEVQFLEAHNFNRKPQQADETLIYVHKGELDCTVEY